jgi:hypothetical protein
MHLSVVAFVGAIASAVGVGHETMGAIIVVIGAIAAISWAVFGTLWWLIRLIFRKEAGVSDGASPEADQRPEEAISGESWQTTIGLRNAYGIIVSALVECDVRRWHEGQFSRRRCNIILKFNGTEIAGSDTDFFEALCRVRERLELLGLVPLCYGASRNVFPSGMARDMGDGLKAYRLDLGVPKSINGMVEIFDTGPDVDPVPVAVQRQFYDAFLNAFGRRSEG